MNKKNGTFLAHDARGNAVVLAWEEIAGKTEQLGKKIRSLSDILVPAYTQTEVEFARAKPAEVANDFMLKSLAPLLAHGEQQTDWVLFGHKAHAVLDQFFKTLDWAQNSGDQDVSIFVLACDQKTGQRLGVIQFLITPEYAQNNIHPALYGVISEAHNRGVEQLLMCSIFKLRPDVKRLFIDTRATNAQAIARYKNWGFAPYASASPNWANLEYVTEKSDTLQKTAKTLIKEN